MNSTHDPELRSWIETANEPECDFPIQNLPVGVFAFEGEPAVGIGIGDQILFPSAALSSLQTQKSPLDAETISALQAPDLRALMALPRSRRQQLRAALSALLSENCPVLRDDGHERDRALRPMSAAEHYLPLQVTDYSDFYASVYHATNVGSMFRPDNPLLPNYKWIPIGYHGRCSSIVKERTPIRRPVGQLTPAEDRGQPGFGPCRLLDYELEVGIWVAEENVLGEAISIERAEERLFGICLLNDWSARDLQKWEYQPLGPFLAKSFATSISPWIVTAEALEPFRAPAFQRAPHDPEPLAYLDSAKNREQGGVDLTLEVYLTSAQMRAAGHSAMRLSQASLLDMYWTPAQMITHHASNGCNLKPGDLLGSGTVSGKARSSRGCLLELTWDGELDQPVPGTQRTPIQLPTGEERIFLVDGDEIALSGYCQRDGFRRIGLGTCRGTVIPAETA